MQFPPHLIFYSFKFYILHVCPYTEIWLYIRSTSIYIGGDAEHADRVLAFVQFDKKRKIESFKRCGKSEFGGPKDESLITFSKIFKYCFIWWFFCGIDYWTQKINFIFFGGHFHSRIVILFIDLIHYFNFTFHRTQVLIHLKHFQWIILI